MNEMIVQMHPPLQGQNTFMESPDLCLQGMTKILQPYKIKTCNETKSFLDMFRWMLFSQSQSDLGLILCPVTYPFYSEG